VRACSIAPERKTPVRDRLPLLERFPALAQLPRVSLGRFPTPVMALHALSSQLWIKRDDLCADPMGGNKVRALEFLLGGVRQGDSVVTVGSAGSTHALAVATYGKRLGAHVVVGRWKQEMNAAAIRVASRLAREADDAPIFSSPALAYIWATTARLRGARWIAAGGSTPLGVLGHTNAGLELIAQIEAGLLPQPERVVVPLGTGGTAAGLALAFAIAQRDIVVVGARVVPRIVARRGRVVNLANGTARLIERLTGDKVTRVSPERVHVAHGHYGGAYGRETGAGREAASRLRSSIGIALDATYSAKAFALAAELAERGPTLFWLTFDSRTLIDHE
jgi:D-cysteine desulfhydrase